MAYQTQLTQWLYKNKSALNAQFKELNWAQDYGMPIYDFQTQISYNDITVRGRGIDLNRHVAFEKSIAESVEFLICLFNGVQSSGTAVGSGFDPSFHAQHECLERYFLNYHLKHNLGFAKLEHESQLVKDFSRKNPNMEINFYKMNTEENFQGVICKVGNPQKLITSFGFALSEDQNTSIEKSFLEALPNMAWLEKNKTNIDKNIWQLQPEFVTKINSLIQAPASKKIRTPKLVEVRLNQPEEEIWVTAPFQIVRYEAKGEV